tara:strand:+ start:1063 stop:1416 length:354 start_codon:yes stop_codon:yes gene_type:complete
MQKDLPDKETLVAALAETNARTTTSYLKLETGFSNLEMLARSYHNALTMLSEHTGRECNSLRRMGGARIQVSQEGIDNVRRYYEAVQTGVPTETYQSLRWLADRMYGELSEVMIAKD